MEGVPYVENHGQNQYQPVPGILPYPTQPYPPQQMEYNLSEQPGYPKDVLTPDLDYNTSVPPPYSVQAQIVQQQSITNVVVVQQQPTTVYTPIVVRASGDNFLTLSIVLTILCFLCGTWYSLLCTLPAIFLASAARDAERKGNLFGARQKRNAALICNIIACVGWVFAFLLIVIPIAVIVNSTSNSSCYNYSCNYSDSYYYDSSYYYNSYYYYYY